MTPFDDFLYLINSVLLGEDPSIEDFILLIGTFVAFVAFILWCCFPIVPKDTNIVAPPLHYETKYNHYRKNQESEYNSAM